MSGRENIDELLQAWPFSPKAVMARRSEGDDGREVLQMRIDLGVLQMETDGRPDGERPHGESTYYDYLLSQVFHAGDDFELSEDQCDEVDREFAQFYHRRMCWLALREFRRAQEDADHTLRLMDFCSAHAPDEQWALSHEQYRPFVMFHRYQAAALAAIDEGAPETALDALEKGLGEFESLYEHYEAEEHFEDDEMVGRLRELRDQIQRHYGLGPTLSEELAEAVAQEEYERAARLRDEIARRGENARTRV